MGYMCNGEGILGLALLGVGLLEGYRDHTCCGLITKSLSPSSSSVFTPAKWPLVPTTFSSEGKGSDSNYLQLNLSLKRHPQEMVEDVVLPHLLYTEFAARTSLRLSTRGWVTHRCSAWCPPSHWSPAASLDATPHPQLQQQAQL